MQLPNDSRDNCEAASSGASTTMNTSSELRAPCKSFASRRLGTDDYPISTSRLDHQSEQK